MRIAVSLLLVLLMFACANSASAVDYTTIMDYARATYTGGWDIGASASAFRFNFKYTSSQAFSTARWCPALDYPGTYNLFLWQASGQFGLAHYTIQSLTGTDEYVVDQSVGVGKWTLLATKQFSTGANGFVRVDNSLGWAVSADAVKWQLAVPEASSILALTGGLSGLAFYSRRKRRPS